MIRVTAVLACHNRKAKTLACLDSLVRQDRAVALRIVLFDDGSGDGTAAEVRRQHPEAIILRGDGTAFWSGGMRAAFTAALNVPSDYYLWLNDDVRLAPNALRRLLATAEARAVAGERFVLVGGAVADPATGRTSYAGIRRSHSGRPLRFARQAPDPDAPVRCDTLVGNVVLIPQATAVRFGSIGPAYRHTLGDLDYGLRVAAAGGWVGLAPGHVGTCARDTGGGRWFDPELPLAARWRLQPQPLGFPLRPWLHFARRHGGPLWPLFAPLPFWRLLVPVGLSRWIDRRRAAPEAAGHPRHA